MKQRASQYLLSALYCQDFIEGFRLFIFCSFQSKFIFVPGVIEVISINIEMYNCIKKHLLYLICP